MTTFRRFEDIEAWRSARELARETYALTGKGPFGRDFALRDQIRRASVSVMSNIAEGFERSGTNEFVQFRAVAKGSAAEVESHLYVARDQAYIDESQFLALQRLNTRTRGLPAGLIHYLRRSGLKGAKRPQERTAKQTTNHERGTMNL